MSDKIFETSDLDLAAFLMLQGVKYLEARVDFDATQRRPKAIMRFVDEKQNARDLERIFMTSQEKRFREIHKYLLKEAHQAVNDYTRSLIETQE